MRNAVGAAQSQSHERDGDVRAAARRKCRGAYHKQIRMVMRPAETIANALFRIRSHAAAADGVILIIRLKKTVTSMIRYPIAVYVDQKKTKIDNEEQMTASYDAIFTTGYRKAIENALPGDMFARYGGIMLGGHGEVWFDNRGRVVALNNLLTK